MKKALFLILFFTAIWSYGQEKKHPKSISLEPAISLGAGWWVYDKTNTNQWDRSHYIANFDLGGVLRYHLNKFNVGVGLTHRILDEDELIAYNERSVRNKYKLTDGFITFNFYYITGEYQIIQHKNFKLGPALAFGTFSTPVNYPNHEIKDTKTFWKMGISNEIGLRKNTSLHVQLQYVTMNIKPQVESAQKNHIYNLSLLFGVRFYLL